MARIKRPLGASFLPASPCCPFIKSLRAAEGPPRVAQAPKVLATRRRCSLMPLGQVGLERAGGRSRCNSRAEPLFA